MRTGAGAGFYITCCCVSATKLPRNSST